MEMLVFILFIGCLYLAFKVIGLEKRISEIVRQVESKISVMEYSIKAMSEKQGPDTETSREPVDSGPPSDVQFYKVSAESVETTPEEAEPFQTDDIQLPDLPVPPPLPEIPEDELPDLPEPDVFPSLPESVLTGEDSTEPEGVDRPHRKKENEFLKKWNDFKDTVDWELFTGTKLFAWLGVFALFIGIVFFVKLSIDRGWFPPALRLAIGAVAGLSLCLFSLKKMSDTLVILKHTFASAGIGTLYSVVFAATLYYDFLPKPAGFLLLCLITATAFVLSVFHKGISISILGAIGACLTPLLVNTGQGSLPMLFLYLSVVNIGLYLVMTRLLAPRLLLVGTAGTLVTLGLSTASLFRTTSGTVTGSVWTANLILFSLFLYLQKHRTLSENKSLAGCGFLNYLSVIVVAILLTLLKPGWMPLFLLTTAVSGSVMLTWFQSGWYRYLIPYVAITFVACLFWTVFRFDATGFSVSYLLIFLYGSIGCLGPLALVRRHGVTPHLIKWFKVFPVAVSVLCLAGLVKNPACSFLFWPVMLGIQLIGIGISLIIRAFIQILLLLVLFVAGGLFWLANIPETGLGFGFFAFILLAGTLLSLILLVAVTKLPEIIRVLNMDPSATETGSPGPDRPQGKYDQWLTAAPAAGVFVLLGAAFMVDHPHYPHPGMATLTSFLILALFFSRRILFEPSAVTALVASTLSQAVWVLLPFTGIYISGGDDTLFHAMAWSGVMFTAALLSPFLFFKHHETWKKTWNTFAVVELAQFLFFLVSAKHYFAGDLVNWLPVIPVLVKLPCVALLLKHLKDKTQRNSILAFHGGVLLFYVSILPVLVLDHGWIGLALVVEGTALLWLNTRIFHPGLRTVAMIMSPVGIVILLTSVPLLKTPESLKLLNPAILSVAAAIVALSGAVKLAALPDRRHGKIDVQHYFLWIALSTGFYLINLMISDLFAPNGHVFRVLPDGNFLHSASYALAWTCFGTILWKLKSFPEAMRKAGFVILFSGAVYLGILPVLLPASISAMPPLLNPALYTFLPLLVMLYAAFFTESYDEFKGLSKNLFLALFLMALFMMIKTVKSTVFQPGYHFSLFTAHTPSQAVSSAAGFFLYGTALLIWPRRLDRPFRLAGLILLFFSLAKAVLFPLRFPTAFGGMTPILNTPTLLYGFILVMLVFFARRSWKEPWPLTRPLPGLLWGIVFAVTAFYVMNVEIASCFGVKVMRFTFSTQGNWGKSFGYSLGWLFFSIGVLVTGIRLPSSKTRWAAIILLSITSAKIFFVDLWSLGQGYRVGSLIGLAVVLILVSYLYQRYIAVDSTSDKG